MPEEPHLAHHGGEEVVAKRLVFQESVDARDVYLDDIRVFACLGGDGVAIGLEERDLFKGVRLGPTLPAFVSENVKAKIIEAFELKVTSDVESDLAAIVG